MEFVKEGNAFVYRDEEGQLLAEITYVEVNPHVIDVNHTFVSPVLRGQGIARKLVDRVVLEAEQTNRKILPTCPYVVSLFAKESQYDAIKA